jgi:hypothetical protein
MSSPTDASRNQVSPYVLERLEQIDRMKWRLAWVAFTGGLAVGVVIGLIWGSWDG